MSDVEHCEECGLPKDECSALALARIKARYYLVDAGYTKEAAAEAVDRLIPKRPNPIYITTIGAGGEPDEPIR